jgi:hypothetical protein
MAQYCPLRYWLMTAITMMATQTRNEVIETLEVVFIAPE